MAGRPSHGTVEALKVIRRKRTWMDLDPEACVKFVAKQYGISPSTLWRALGKQKSK